MKRITIIVEDGNGQVTRMGAATEAKLVLLDFGLTAQENAQALAALKNQVNASVMALVLQQEAQNEDSPPPAQEKMADYKSMDENILANGPICMNVKRHEVRIGDRKIGLTPREYGLLECFLRHQGHLLPHREILKVVWGEEHMDDTQYLRVYIGQLRNKLDVSPGLGKLIVAEAGVGYRMDKAELFPKAA